MRRDEGAKFVPRHRGKARNFSFDIRRLVASQQHAIPIAIENRHQSHLVAVEIAECPESARADGRRDLKGRVVEDLYPNRIRVPFGIDTERPSRLRQRTPSGARQRSARILIFRNAIGNCWY
jgi:hypothetical protein